MNYTKEWYLTYTEQLQEPIVRKTHNEMFHRFYSLCNFHDYYDINNNCFVVDLGCATCEFFKYGKPAIYLGVDLNSEIPQLKRSKTVIADYTKINLSETFKKFYNINQPPNSFVSLFSTELYFNYPKKYKFYNKIFIDNPDIMYGMVAGFLYKDKTQTPKIVENSAGWSVYQTLEAQEYYISDIFDEFRIYVKVPSKMFGPNLVEVWKFFTRKQ